MIAYPEIQAAVRRWDDEPPPPPLSDRQKDIIAGVFRGVVQVVPSE